ncbi:MAG: methyltransferase domain-containing protein, partial [Pseudomonadota bacterium]
MQNVSFVSRVTRSLENRSFREISLLILKNLIHAIKSANIRRLFPKKHPFDEKWGVETTRTHSLNSFQIDSKIARHGARYQAGDGDRLLEIMDDIPIPYENFNFIDFGSGKGRIVMCASLRNFARVYGVEISQELVAFSKKNLEIFKEKANIKSQIEIQCINAQEFSIPSGNLVCYFYNPFDEEILRPIIEKLEDIIKNDNYHIHVVYAEALHRDVF